MRTSIYILAAVAVAGFATVSAQNTGNPAATPGTQTPVRQSTTSAPPSTPAQQTVRPPDSRRTADQTDRRLNNPANNQQRVPFASRGVGTTGKPDCSKLRGLEKSECERRDTSRDDLPAGVTSKQPEK